MELVEEKSLKCLDLHSEFFGSSLLFFFFLCQFLWIISVVPAETESLHYSDSSLRCLGCD